MPGIEGALHWCAPGPDRSNGNLVYSADPIASLIITTAKGVKSSQLLTLFLLKYSPGKNLKDLQMLWKSSVIPFHCPNH